MTTYKDINYILEHLPDNLPYKGVVKRVLIQAPAAHVTEVKFGDWTVEVDEEIKTPWLKNRYCCSECGNWQSYGRTPFCPNCGAKMSVRRTRNTPTIIEAEENEDD